MALHRERLNELLKTYRNGLLEDTLPFWTDCCVDREYGGFMTYVDAAGNVLNTDKSVWSQGRFTWLLSRLCNVVEKRADWLELAQHGVTFLRKHAFDADGRCFFRLTRDGRPLCKRRYLFSETFVAIALAEWARASGDEAARREAGDLYRRIIMCHNTPGILPPKILPQTRQMKSHAMPMILLATTQCFRELGHDPRYDEVAKQAVHEILHHFVHRDERALLENVGPDGQRLQGPDGRLVNPGHAIESAAFLMEESQYLGDARLLGEACQVLDWSLDLGWDKEYGGILYFVDVEGKPPAPYEHDMKLWWPHVEAIYASLLAYHLTGNEKYWRDHGRIHEWAYSHFPDRDHGEWFGYLHRDGTLSTTLKGNHWKGPFHLPRMQLKCWHLIERMLAGPQPPSADS